MGLSEPLEHLELIWYHSEPLGALFHTPLTGRELVFVRMVVLSASTYLGSAVMLWWNKRLFSDLSLFLQIPVEKIKTTSRVVNVEKSF